MSTGQAARPVTYRLVRAHREPVGTPALDADQRRVVDHAGGPLLVLAGPGTGKTTTLVEAVVERVRRRGLRPDQLLVLTFSRKAAEELRDRITARLGHTVATPLSMTFHSFSYALVRRFQPADAFAHPLQLLSAPEQDVRIRELLRGSLHDGSVRWPPSLRPAMSTRGLAEEVRGLMSRARELGLDPDQLEHIGAESGRPEWAALGSFFAEYLEVLGFQNCLDYSELVHRAVLLAERPDVQAVLRADVRAVFVDEYQDTDRAQVRLLRALAGDGRDLVAVGDPDQSIYGFRGADAGGILRFPQQFRQRGGAPAPVVPLGTTRRFGPRLLTATRRVAAGLGLPGAIERSAFEIFRSPVAEAGTYGEGRVDVFTYSSSGAELEHVADLLRRAHLEDGIGWAEMAVLVRSGRRSIPALRRALVAAGVPVEVAGDEVPLRFEPSVQPLLLALRAAADRDSLTAAQAEALLVSPLAGLDATEVRALARELRRRDREAHGDVHPGEDRRGDDQDGEIRSPRASAELVREALLDPRLLLLDDSHAAGGARALAALLADAAALLAAGAPPEQALWCLWSGTGWPDRLRAAVDKGGAAARTAHRDLDAICALFETAARAEERAAHRGVSSFLAELDSQQIPADTLADKGAASRDAVRLLTAHRAKGLEWRLVVVPGVQEGSWPDLRRRGSMLQADRLSRDGATPPPSGTALLAEERRLFYVATTRARQRLVVTAVSSPDAEGEQPSRLLEELGVRIQSVPGRPSRPMSLAGVVAALRRIAGDPSADEALRRAAAARLARLADARLDPEDTSSRLLAPAADPRHWWGMRAPSESGVPVRGERPLRLSGSSVDAIGRCALRWFLSREAGGATATTAAVGFGNVVHLLAQQVADGDLAPDVPAMLARLDSVWSRLRFAAPWVSRRERQDAEAALQRFVAWHSSSRRRLLAAEHAFEAIITVAGEQVVLHGAMDRVEVNGDGAVVVVDLKTGKTVVTAGDMAEHAQLGSYQLAVEHGGVDELVPGDGRRPGGAELVFLRQPAGKAAAGSPKVLRQEPLAAGADQARTTPEQQVERAVLAIRGERFQASANGFCARCEFRSLCPLVANGPFVLSAPEGVPDGGD